METQRKTGPLRVRLQFVGAKADITFQRGTATDKISDAIWEDGRRFVGSQRENYATASLRDNTGARMSAMHLGGRELSLQAAPAHFLACALRTFKGPPTHIEICFGLLELGTGALPFYVKPRLGPLT